MYLNSCTLDKIIICSLISPLRLSFTFFTNFMNVQKHLSLNECWLISFTDMKMCPSCSLKHPLENIEQLESMV